MLWTRYGILMRPVLASVRPNSLDGTGNWASSTWCWNE
jgi:hypothetical protein